MVVWSGPRHVEVRDGRRRRSGREEGGEVVHGEARVPPHGQVGPLAHGGAQRFERADPPVPGREAGEGEHGLHVHGGGHREGGRRAQEEGRQDHDADHEGGVGHERDVRGPGRQRILAARGGVGYRARPRHSPAGYFRSFFASLRAVTSDRSHPIAFARLRQYTNTSASSSSTPSRKPASFRSASSFDFHWNRSRSSATSTLIEIAMSFGLWYFSQSRSWTNAATRSRSCCTVAVASGMAAGRATSDKTDVRLTSRTEAEVPLLVRASDWAVTVHLRRRLRSI